MHTQLLRMAAAGLVAATVAAQPAAAATSGPKAYVGLFKDDAVAVLDTSTNEVVKRIGVPAGPHGIVITPDGRRLYVSSDGDAVVSVIETSKDEITDSIDVGASPHGLAITPDGAEVLVAGFGTDRVEAIDSASNQLLWQVAVPQPHNIAITPDGKTAYAGAQKEGAQQLAVIDIASGTQTATIPLDRAPRALSVSPDGAYLAYTLAGVDAVQVLDLATREAEAAIPTGASPHHPIYTPDGMGMVVSQGPGTLDFFDGGSVKVGDMPHWIGLGAGVAYVTNEKSNDVSVVDLATRIVTATVAVGNAPRKIVVQPSADAAQVNIAGFAFAPSRLSAKLGQTITFANQDAVAHTVTSDAAVWDSGDIAPSASFSVTLDKAGTYAYHCSVHPFMKGSIVVQ